MESSFQKIIAAIVGIMILFLIPVYIAFEKVDDVSYTLVLKLTQNFVDNVRDKGYISPEMYSDFVSGIYATNNAYDVNIEHVKKRYDPALYVYEKKDDGTNGKLLHVLDYTAYTDNGKLPNQIKINDTITYVVGDNCKVEKGHIINDEHITDKQIVDQLFKDTGVDKSEFLRQCLLGNGDMYSSLSYMNENSYMLNEGDEITVSVRNRNKTIASIFYSLFTANVGEEDIAKIYVNYGGTVRNSGTSVFTEKAGLVDSEEGRLFKYQGRPEEVTLAPGIYEFECWGAAGGGKDNDSSSNDGGDAGKGAYMYAQYEITEETTFYVYVGEKGSMYAENNKNNGGYNGGGNSYKGYGGGGATDIRLLKGETDDTASLLTRIMVAAGGGGASGFGSTGKGGIGINWENSNGDGYPTTDIYKGLSAVKTTISVGYDSYQSAGEILAVESTEKGNLGKGGSVDFEGAGAGGSGYFGGSASHSKDAGGGGGISYVYTMGINNKNGVNYPLPYILLEEYQIDVLAQTNDFKDSSSGKWNGITYISASYKNGEDTGMPNPLEYTGSSTMIGNSGNGYARIKKIG